VSTKGVAILYMMMSVLCSVKWCVPCYQYWIFFFRVLLCYMQVVGYGQRICATTFSWRQSKRRYPRGLCS